MEPTLVPKYPRLSLAVWDIFVIFALVMKRVLSFVLYNCLGWKTDICVPPCEKCVMCVAPHTSNLDFLYAFAYDRSRGGKAHFLMKKFWFFWPLGVLLRSWGGVAVDRNRKNNLTDELADIMRMTPGFRIAVTPEGTRSVNREWKMGFYYIALKAQVPIRLYVLDYSSKTIVCKEQIMPTGDAKADMGYIKSYYAKFKFAARYPDKFEV